jgi:hypothetical protein
MDRPASNIEGQMTTDDTTKPETAVAGGHLDFPVWRQFDHLDDV